LLGSRSEFFSFCLNIRTRAANNSRGLVVLPERSRSVQALTVIGRALRLVSYLALVGVLALVLLVPVLAIVITTLALVVAGLAVMLPFALIGALVWLPYEMFLNNRHVAWEKLSAKTRTLGRWLRDVPLRGCVDCCAWGARTVRVLAPKAGRAAHRVVEVASAGVAKVVPVARRVGAISLETLCGAAVGVILVTLTHSGEVTPSFGLRLFVGALGGAVIGTIVGVSIQKRKRAAEVKA
jgi:hypothetical protein